MLTSTQWDKFFELLDSIVNPDDKGELGPWQERSATVRAEAVARDAEGALEEFAGWFAKA